MKQLTTIEMKAKELEIETKRFELEQRRSLALSKSAFFPATLKNDVASAVIIYDIAERMNISVMEVAQSIYIIHGRPAFSTAFLVARLNQSGLIKGALKTIVSEDKQSAHCEAVDKQSGELLVGMTVTMEMAEAEGWLGKQGSKWKTMPELMLRKRAQSFFIKEFYPETMFGMQTKEELEDTSLVEDKTAKTKELNKIFKTAPIKDDYIDTEFVNETTTAETAEEEAPKKTDHPFVTFMGKCGIPLDNIPDFLMWSGLGDTYDSAGEACRKDPKKAKNLALEYVKTFLTDESNTPKEE